MTEPFQERERRLHEVLGTYFEAVEAGGAPSPEELMAQHSDLADDLASFFASDKRFQRLVASSLPTPEPVTSAPEPAATIARTPRPDQPADALKCARSPQVRVISQVAAFPDQP